MQRINEADGADPEKSYPTEKGSTEQGDHNHRDFGARPELVDTASELGAVLHLIRGLRLVKPAQMRPPEASVGRAGNVIGTIGVDVMVAMIGDPTSRSARSIEHRPEDQEVLDELIELE